LDDRIQACRRQLAECLAGLGEPEAGERETLAALLERCGATVERIESAAVRRQQLDKEARQWNSRLAAAQAAIKAK
jgi:predicted ATPase